MRLGRNCSFVRRTFVATNETTAIAANDVRASRPQKKKIKTAKRSKSMTVRVMREKSVSIPSAQIRTEGCKHANESDAV